MKESAAAAYLAAQPAVEVVVIRVIVVADARPDQKLAALESVNSAVRLALKPAAASVGLPGASEMG